MAVDYGIFLILMKRHTWFDRDLGLAGRVFVHSDKGTIDSKLVNVRRYFFFN
jgi:aspartyl aminopeptidase